MWVQGRNNDGETMLVNMHYAVAIYECPDGTGMAHVAMQGQDLDKMHEHLHLGATVNQMIGLIDKTNVLEGIE